MTLDSIAMINGKKKFSEFLTENKMELESIHKEYDDTPSYSFLDLFKLKSLRLPSIGFILSSFSMHILYYGE